jgi:hypothetical protein
MLTNSATGENQMFVAHDRLVLFVAGARELLSFNLSGELSSRIPLSPMFNKIANTTGSDQAQILGLAPTKKGQLIAQMRLLPADPHTGRVRFALVSFANDASWWELASEPAVDLRFPGIFLGTTHSGSYVFLRPTGSNMRLAEYNRLPNP